MVAKGNEGIDASYSSGKTAASISAHTMNERGVTSAGAGGDAFG